MKKLRTLGMTLATTLLSSSLALAVSFSDIEEHWGRKAIDDLVSKKIINGYEDGTFRPDNKITREEVAALICRMAFGEVSKPEDEKPEENAAEDTSKEENADKENTEEKSDSEKKEEDKEDKNSEESMFKDIEGRYSTEYIKTLAEKNIINGYEDGTFRPGNNISREEFGTILYRYAKRENLIDFEKTGKLKDSADVSDWAKEPIASMIGNGLIKGDTEGEFNPQNSITRAEAAQMIFNLSELKEENEKEKEKYMKTAETVVLLKEANEDSDPVSSDSILKKGTEVQVLGEEGDFYLVKATGIEDAEQGYVKKTDLEESENSNPDFYKERKMKVVKEVKLRLQPVHDAGFIGKNSTLEPGTEVIVLGEATDYFLVKPAGVENAYIGYGLKSAFEEVEEEEHKDDESGKKYMIANSEVRLLLQPLNDAETISKNGVLPKGTRFVVEGEATEYYLVRPTDIEDAFRGYVKKDLLDEVK